MPPGMTMPPPPDMGAAMATPGGGPGGDSPMPGNALNALSSLGPRPNPTQSMQKVEEAFTLAHQLVMSVLPQLTQWNPKLASQGHGVAKMLLTLRSDLRKEAAPDPPPDLMMGMGAAGAGSPLGPPSTMGGGTMPS
jgi:hypothetical protein